MGNQQGKFQNQNQSGRPKKNVHWKSAERPSSPGRPVLIPLSDQQPDVVNLRWERPTTDGGSPITGYVVEHRRMGSPHWVRATPTAVVCCEASLSGLEPGWRYQFRVFAENVVGRSDPSELSDALTVTLQRNAISVPRFVNELNDMFAVEDDRVEFQVRVAGQPPPEINWFKDGYEIFSSRRTKIVNEDDTSTLIIHQVALTDEGEIKCTATNRAGHVVTKARLFVQAPPRIRLPRTYEDGLIVEAEEVLRLKVGIAGQPSPTVTWLHEGEIIMHDGRFEITSTDRNSMLKIANVKRDDRGEYSIRAWNKLGEDVASFLVTVTARPDPPGKVCLVMSFGKSATFSWTAPTDDGGCKIGNYIVEYFRTGWNVWLKAATTRSLSTTLNDLIEGSEYRFRVKAENPYGVSDPSEESEVLFIPDPKRGITKPKSEVKISENNKKPLPPRRKTLSPLRPQQDAATETAYTVSQKHKQPELPDCEVLHQEMSYGTPDRVLRIESPKISPSKTINPEQSYLNEQNAVEELKQRSPKVESPNEAHLTKPKPTHKDKPVPPLFSKLHKKMDTFNNPRDPDQNAISNTKTLKVEKVLDDNKKSPITQRAKTPLERLLTTPALQRSTEPIQLGVNQNVRRYSNHSISTAKDVPTLAIAIATSSMGVAANSVATKQNASTITNPTIEISAPPPTNLTSNNNKNAFNFPKVKTEMLPLSETDRHDEEHTSNEFMLVVFNKNSKVKDKNKQDSFELDLEDALQPPPISISSPELASMEFTNLNTLYPMRRSVSSTELLYERAMARFYEAVELEEAEKTRKSQIVQEKRTSTSNVPTNLVRRRLGSMTETERLSFEKRKEKRRLSSDLKGVPTKWDSRENISQFGSLTKTTSLTNKSSRKMHEHNKNIDYDFQVGSAPENVESYMDSDYTESTASSDNDSIEKFKQELLSRTRSPSPRDLETYHPRNMGAGIFTPYQAPESPISITTPPNPDFVLKPILKRTVVQQEQSPPQAEIVPIPVSVPTPIPVPEKSSLDIASGIKSFFRRGNGEKSNTAKETINTVQTKSKINQENEPKIQAATSSSKRIVEDDVSAKRKLKDEEDRKRKEAENLMLEESHAAVDHYSDLVREISSSRKYHTPLYLQRKNAPNANWDDNDDANEKHDSAEQLRLQRSHSPDGLLRPPISNKPRLSISERGQMVHVRETASNLAFTETNKPATPTDEGDDAEVNELQFESLPIPFYEETNQNTFTDTAKVESTEIETFGRQSPSIEEIGKEKLDTPRGRSRIVKVSRIIKRRVPSSSRDPSTSRAQSSTKVVQDGENSSTGAHGTVVRRRVLSQSRTRVAGNSLSPVSYVRTVSPVEVDIEVNNMNSNEQQLQNSEFESEDMREKVNENVRSALSYSTDLVLFIVACYIYLFKDARLVLPILALMIYRQLGEAISAYKPSWMK